jgi:hypothetical protein
MGKHFKLITVILGITCGGIFGARSLAQTAGPTVMREYDQVALDEKGDATFTGSLVFPTEGSYNAYKAQFPSAFLLLRSIIGSMGKSAVADTDATYDDSKHALVLKETILGAAVNQRNRWRALVGPPAENPELVFSGGEKCILMKVATSSNLIVIDRIDLALPGKCENVRLADDGWLNYSFDRTAKPGPVSVDVDLNVKPRIISACYKSYGNADFADGHYWVAKALFTNSGDGDISNLRISYRLGDYAPWSTETGHEYNLVAAGGHVVDLYYPILDPKVAALTSPTPVDLEVKYSYTDSSGKEYDDSVSKRIQLLGATGMEWSNLPEEERQAGQTVAAWKDNFSNSPLTAAFVTFMDPPVRALNGLVHQSAGEAIAGAGQTNAATQAFCEALFLVERANGLQYQNATGYFVDYDKSGQSLKFPRDTMRDKSGTCIELAILYAAVCESSGVKCDLMCVPGHCFPVVQLPEGGQLAVESTAVQDVDKDGKPVDFDAVTAYGAQEYSKYLASGAFYQVDVEKLQGAGAEPPELPAVDNDAISKWGWKTVTLTKTK